MINYPTEPGLYRIKRKHPAASWETASLRYSPLGGLRWANGPFKGDAPNNIEEAFAWAPLIIAEE